MKDNYAPSFLDWLAFISCALFNPILILDICQKIQKSKRESEEFQSRFMDGVK